MEPEKKKRFPHYMFIPIPSQLISTMNKMLYSFTSKFSTKNSPQVKICRLVQFNLYHTSLSPGKGFDNSQSAAKTRL